MQSTPAFGTADLSNCEREQIHLAGSIQPFGALLLVREPDLTIALTSANAADFLHMPGPLLGRSLDSLPGNLMERLGPLLDEPLDGVPVAIRCRVGMPAADVNMLVHRPAGAGLIVEFEPGGVRVDLARDVQSGLTALTAAASLELLCDETARVFRETTGYDRVMVYRFDPDGHGQVFAENRRADLEPFLGNWYPASDIPQIARRLYERNRVRVLADVAYAPVPLMPPQSPISGDDLDMSMCVLRSMSPLHIQYLKNMGVAATLVASLMVGGRLWGLVACHHYSPRVAPFEVRSVCELLAEAVATRIAALDAFVQSQAEFSVRRLEQRMVDAISTKGDWRTALFDRSKSLLTLLRASGAALLLDDEILTVGDVPGTQSLRQVRSWLESCPAGPMVATAALGKDVPDLVTLLPDVGGLLAVPVSNGRADYLVWFRTERLKTVTWGGNPTKPFTVGNSPLDLSPRRSFAQWHELVEGTCETWSPADQATAQMIGDMVSDVVLQFRAVRMLIAQDQLEKVGREVDASQQPTVVADPKGRILMTNGAFLALFDGRPAPVRLADLPSLFETPEAVDRSLQDLVRRMRSWRDEVRFLAAGGRETALLVRGDPVIVAPGRVLGFVLLFLDVSERRVAEEARTRFLGRIEAPHRFGASRVAVASDPVFHSLMSAIVENAQVAALEISDGFDVGHAPERLDAIQSSVDRAAALLEQLVWRAARARDDEA